MQAEHLHYWLATATCEEWTDTTKWEWVVEILQMAFSDRKIPMKCTCHTVVIITEEYR